MSLTCIILQNGCSLQQLCVMMSTSRAIDSDSFLSFACSHVTKLKTSGHPIGRETHLILIIFNGYEASWMLCICPGCITFYPPQDPCIFCRNTLGTLSWKMSNSEQRNVHQLSFGLMWAEWNGSNFHFVLEALCDHSTLSRSGFSICCNPPTERKPTTNRSMVNMVNVAL